MKVKLIANKIFKEVHQSKKRYIVMKGSAGSGKSVDTAQQYIIRLMADKGRNLCCVRKSDITNRYSTFAELTSAINRMGVQKYWRTTLTPLTLTCVNGNQIIFRGMNDEKQKEKLKSITFPSGKLTDVWIEEATELTQADVEIIDDRLRGVLPDGLFYQIKMTFNPVSATHWIKKVYFDTPDENVLTHHSTYLDNRFIDEAYYKRMERRKLVDPEGYRVYGLGDWGVLGGLILTNWEAKEFDQKPESFDSCVNAQDFGFNHANCLLQVGFKDGDLYICKESYHHELDTSELIIIANKEGFRKDLRMWCDSAEPDRIKMWKRDGYRAKAVKKGQGSVKAQIDYLKQHRIFVHPSCVNTIKELQQWSWKKDEKSGLYIDSPLEVMDDAMAALRYSVETERRKASVIV